MAKQEIGVLPDWGKVEFHPFPAQPWENVLKGASSKGRDLVRSLLCYESSKRLSAAEVCGEIQRPRTFHDDLIIFPGSWASVLLQPIIMRQSSMNCGIGRG